MANPDKTPESVFTLAALNYAACLKLVGNLNNQIKNHKRRYWLCLTLMALLGVFCIWWSHSDLLIGMALIFPLAMLGNEERSHGKLLRFQLFTASLLQRQHEQAQQAATHPLQKVSL